MRLEPDPRDRRDILRLFKDRGGWLRQPDLLGAGYHPRWLDRLESEKVIFRVRRGLYKLAQMPVHARGSLVDACRAVPGGILCLLSALSVHDLTEANPPEVYLAIGRGTWAPRVAYPPLRYFRFTDRQLRLGAMNAPGPLRVFDREKTICDCIRHRKVVGNDLMIAALRRYLARKGRDLDRLVRMSRECRVEKQLHSYLEALL
jgi:predicted transcriptional regulator of viral defense system